MMSMYAISIGFVAGFGASASVYARASAAVSLLIVRGGVSIDLAIFDGSLSPKLTLDLKQVCGVANLVISALSGHIDAYYQTRGCGHWWNAYSEWCDAKSLTLLSWNGPQVQLSWPSQSCYPILGLPPRLALPAPPMSDDHDDILATSTGTPSGAISHNHDDSGQDQQRSHDGPPEPLVTLEYFSDDCNGNPIPAFVVNFSPLNKIPIRTAYTQLAQTAAEDASYRQRHFTKCDDDDVDSKEQASNSDYSRTGWDKVRPSHIGPTINTLFQPRTSTRCQC
jgi:hypothetical protein